MGVSKALNLDSSATNQSAPALSTNIVWQDERGSITTLNFNKGEYTLIYTREGFSRGGDFHPTKQHAILLDGKATWTEKIGENSARTSSHMLYTDFVIEENVPHFLTAESDSVIAVWLDGGVFKQNIDDELRQRIASRNASVHNAGSVPASEKTENDDRGSIATLTYNEDRGLKKYRIIHTKEGFSRGGHYHPSKRHAVLLDGDVTWVMQKSARDSRIEMVHQMPGKMVEINEWVPHFFKANRNSLIISWQEGMKYEQYADSRMRSLMRN